MHALKKLPAVEADVAEAAEWYEARRPGLGDAFIAAVQSADRELLAAPLRYSARYADIRRFNLRRFPYGIFFFLDGDALVVLGVLHARRDIRAVLERRRQLG